MKINRNRITLRQIWQAHRKNHRLSRDLLTVSYGLAASLLIISLTGYYSNRSLTKKIQPYHTEIKDVSLVCRGVYPDPDKTSQIVDVCQTMGQHPHLVIDHNSADQLGQLPDK